MANGIRLAVEVRPDKVQAYRLEDGSMRKYVSHCADYRNLQEAVDAHGDDIKIVFDKVFYNEKIFRPFIYPIGERVLCGLLPIDEI
jgi:hypothetical protein